MNKYSRAYPHATANEKPNWRIIVLIAVIFVLITSACIVYAYCLPSREEAEDVAITKNLPEPTPAMKTWTVVNDSYFNDAVFIGDSITEGLMLYSGLSSTAKFYTSTGLTVDAICTKPIVKKDKEKITISQALQENSFKKVYIMFGVNELNWGNDELFEKYYRSFLSELKTSQPDAVIYLQSVLPVTHAKSVSDKKVNNDHIKIMNEIIIRLSKEFEVNYLDVAAVVSDDTGALKDEASVDGIHLTRKYCRRWLGFLKQNTKERI